MTDQITLFYLNYEQDDGITNEMWHSDEGAMMLVWEVIVQTDPNATIHKVTASPQDIAMLLNGDDISQEQWEDVTPTHTATG